MNRVAGRGGARTPKRLEHAHRRRPDREHPPRGPDPLPRPGRDLVALTVQRVVLDPVDREWPEGVEPDVKGHPLEVEPSQ
jgi:hypothetical protein